MEMISAYRMERRYPLYLISASNVRFLTVVRFIRVIRRGRVLLHVRMIVNIPLNERANRRSRAVFFYGDVIR